jgi:hypothetical protein
MIQINLKTLLYFFLIALTACTSSIGTDEDFQPLNSVESYDDPQSSFELVHNSGIREQISCSPTNSVKFILVQNSDDKILCRDQTRLKPGLSVGEICPGGVEIQNIPDPQGQWVPCEDVLLCGQKALTITPLKSGSSSTLSQMEWSQLPWGCEGSIQTRLSSQDAESGEINEIGIMTQVPRCPLCAATNTETCLSCGDDREPPEIIDVFTESFRCNEIRVRIFAQDNMGLHREPYSFDGGVTWQADSTRVYTGLELQLSIGLIRVRDRSGNIAQWDKNISSTASPCPCPAPWGETIAHGTSVDAYNASTVNCTTTCEANKQVRTCNNGVLSGSNSFASKTCRVTGCPACTLPWGATLQHGASVEAYNLASAPCAGRCLKTTLTCNRGALVGDASTYRFPSCSFTRPSCDCRHGGVVMPNGSTRQVFANETVACGQSCQQSTLRCTDGVLSGQSSYTALSCSVQVCKCRTPWGELLDINQTVAAYKNATFTCDSGMTCDSESNKITVRCRNPENNLFDVVEGTGNLQEFQQQSCSMPSCGCFHLGHMLRENQTMKVYKIAEGVPPARCETEGNFGEVRCTKSGTNFRLLGDTNTNIFKYAECRDLEIPGSGTGTGSSPSDVGVGTGGGAGGGTGNDEGDGDGFRRRGSGGGSGCNINEPPYYCIGGSASIPIKSSFCLLPSENGYSPDVTNDTDFRHRIAPGVTLTLYSRREVSCSDSCSRYQKVVSCDLGVMTDRSEYRYLDCREVCP